MSVDGMLTTTFQIVFGLAQMIVVGIATWAAYEIHAVRREVNTTNEKLTETNTQVAVLAVQIEAANKMENRM